MKKQKSKQTEPKAKIDKNPEKQQNIKEISNENAEGKVIYVNFMAVVMSCVMIFIGVRMLPIKAHQAKAETGSNDIEYEETRNEIESQNNQEKNIVEEIIQEESEQKIEETENIQINENILDVSDEQKNNEVANITKEKYYIENVPFINQLRLGYPMGCEAVSAAMAAKYEGYNIEVETIVANTPTDLKGKRKETVTRQVETINEETGEKVITTKEEVVWVGENPFLYFVGDPKKR